LKRNNIARCWSSLYQSEHRWHHTIQRLCRWVQQLRSGLARRHYRYLPRGGYRFRLVQAYKSAQCHRYHWSCQTYQPGQGDRFQPNGCAHHVLLPPHYHSLHDSCSGRSNHRNVLYHRATDRKSGQVAQQDRQERGRTRKKLLHQYPDGHRLRRHEVRRVTARSG